MDAGKGASIHGEPYSNDLRSRVARAIASGESCPAIAEQYEIATVGEVVEVPAADRTRRSGQIRPIPQMLSRAAPRARAGADRGGAALTLHRLKDMLAALRVFTHRSACWGFQSCRNCQGRTWPWSHRTNLSLAVSGAPRDPPILGHHRRPAFGLQAVVAPPGVRELKPTLQASVGVGHGADVGAMPHG